MLGKFIKIDNEQFPNPVAGTFTRAFYPEENTFLTEAGTQVSNVVRLDRQGWTATFNCSAAMKNKIESKCLQASCECQINGETMNGRLRLSAASTLVAGSEKLPETNGLWVVSVSFEEF